MDRKEMWMGWLRRLGLIHGFTMMMVYVITRLFRADMTFGPSFLGKMILFSLAGTIPGLICYAGRELTEREWWIRTIIHYLLLNLLMLPIARAIGLWENLEGLALLVGLILVVDVLVHMLSYSANLATAHSINRRLKQRQERQQDP